MPGSGDTIFALSSGALPAAIAVVRISGPRAEAALRALTGRAIAPRRPALRALRDSAGVLIDRALVLFFPGPSTATGEDLVELHLHGGRAVVAAVLGALGAQEGLRGAEAGEFTRRALANGRLDLSAAEGLADLLTAETESQRRQALRLAEGGLGRLVEGWRIRLLSLSARVEAAIEFGEDEDDVPAIAPVDLVEIAALAAELRDRLDQPPAERLRDGVRVVLAGPVNAGKSTLLNALAGRDVAITADVAGTTRDLIEVPIILDGLPILLIDGAGLRDSSDPIEQAGIGRIHAAIASADILVWLGKPDNVPAAPHRLIVHSRADVPGREILPPGADLAVSVRTGEGMAALRAAIEEQVRRILPAEDSVALNRRHRLLIEAMHAELAAVTARLDVLFVAEHLRAARIAADRITGAAGVEDMLDALFGRFCIGK